jgi:hypothetical protein
MEAKEKAKELVERFNSGKNNSSPSIRFLTERLAKEHALICVDEIDKAIDFDWMEVQNLDRQHAYWQDVKQEIKNL